MWEDVTRCPKCGAAVREPKQVEIADELRKHRDQY